MRKGTKRIWITTGILLLIGVILIIIGVANHATFDENGFFSHGIGIFYDSDVNFDKDFDMKEFSLVDEYESQQFQSFECNVDSAFVKVVPSSNEQCRVYAQSDHMDQITSKVDGQTLYVNQDGGSNWHLGLVKVTKICVELPQKEYENLMLQVDAGAIELPKIDTEQLKVSIAAGYIEGNQILQVTDADLSVDAGYMKIDTLNAHSQISANVNAGSIELDNVAADKMELTCDLGNISVQYADVADTKVKCDTGNVDLVMAGKRSWYSIDSDNDIGNIDIQSSHDLDDDHISGEEHLEDRSMQLKCDLGNIDVEFEK